VKLRAGEIRWSFYGDVSVVLIHNPSNQRQADSRALVLVLARRVEPMEDFEYPFPLVERYSDSVVTDHEMDDIGR